MAANAACHYASLPLTNSERAAEQMSVNAASVTWSKLNAGAQNVGWASGLQGSRLGARLELHACHGSLGHPYARTPCNQPRGDNDGERTACLGK